MRTLTINLMKHSLQKYYNYKNVRLINNFNRGLNTNSLIRKDDEEIKENILIKKFTELNEWYMQTTGLDEVKKLQDRVIIIQTRLEKAQEERREIGKLLSDARKKATETQELLHNTNRLDNVHRYLDLTKQETEMIRLEKELGTKFEMLDKAEREIFTSLSNAVRDSHEKEKSQAEYTKYWGIILSIVGTILGAVVSTIISTIRNHQIVSGINKGVEDKFVEMVGLLNYEGSEVKSLGNIINENNKTSRIILQKLAATERQIKELYTTSKSLNELVIKDKSLNAENFIKVQHHLLQEHQKQIKSMLIQSKSALLTEEGPNWFLIGGLLFVGLILGKISSS